MKMAAELMVAHRCSAQQHNGSCCDAWVAARGDKLLSQIAQIFRWGTNCFVSSFLRGEVVLPMQPCALPDVLVIDQCSVISVIASAFAQRARAAIPPSGGAVGRATSRADGSSLSRSVPPNRQLPPEQSCLVFADRPVQHLCASSPHNRIYFSPSILSSSSWITSSGLKIPMAPYPDATLTSL